MSEDAPGSPFKRLSADFYAQWERSMTAWWDRVLDAPEVLKAMNANTAMGVEARKGMSEASQRWLERMHLPTREDMIRLTRIATLLEERLLSMEDRMLELQDDLSSAHKEAMRARIDAAEARLEMSEKLSRVEARLAALEGSDG